MGENSKIQWCHHTLNPWIGCAKVSAACRNCYASVSTPVRVLRAKGEETWGHDSVRHETREWARNLRRWNREAIAAGERRRVFCASLADVFEDHQALPEKRARLWPELEAAPGLDILLLTKRPENVRGMVPEAWLHRWPPHVWMGCTVEDQEQADMRIPLLLRIPAALRFLSCEPLLGPVDLTRWLGYCPVCDKAGCEITPAMRHARCGHPAGLWTIAGGESGPDARPCKLEWLRSIGEQCRYAGTPYFLKQLGSRPLEFVVDMGSEYGGSDASGFYPLALKDKHGGSPEEWPSDLRDARAFPKAAA